MKEANLHTDGACSRKRGCAGGWSAILVYRDHELELSGSESKTTHNRMELRAVIEGLRALEEPCRVSVYSDSMYVVKAFTEARLARWERRGWKTVNRTPVLNQDLWEELSAEADLHEITWSWVKGHDGDIYNERADALATAACAIVSPPPP
jgi:ribonuclease HI